MSFNYTRSFGRKKKKPTAPVARCYSCGATALCAVPVFLRPDDPAKDTRVVCYKNICIACGKIQHFTEIDHDGNVKKYYAFWMGQSHRCRDFFIPAEMYEKDGKADVGLKVRLVRAILRLQVARPTEKLFTESEVLQELENDPQQPKL